MEYWNVRTRYAVIRAVSWTFGGILLAAGVALSGNDMAWLSVLVGQAGSPNPRLLEKLRLVPTLIVVTGAQCLLLAVSLWFLRKRTAASWADRVPRLGSTQFGVWLLLCAWTAIAVLSLNFGAITLVNRLKQNRGRSAAELIAADFGDDYRDRAFCARNDTRNGRPPHQDPTAFAVSLELRAIPPKVLFLSGARHIGLVYSASVAGPAAHRLDPGDFRYRTPPIQTCTAKGFLLMRVLLALALVQAVGYLTLRALAGHSSRLRSLELWSLSFGAGCGILSLGLFHLAYWGIPLSPTNILILAAKPVWRLDRPLPRPGASHSSRSDFL